MMEDGFDENIRNACSEFVGYGNPDMMFLNKLKQLKIAIKRWKSKTVREKNKKIDDLKKRMVEIETAVESRTLSAAEIEERLIGGIKIAEHARNIALDLKQRTWLKWEVEGNENSSFFIGMLTIETGKNHIHGIMANGKWTTDPMEIKKESVKFFEKKFHEVWTNRPYFSILVFVNSPNVM